MNPHSVRLFPRLQATVDAAVSSFDRIERDRREVLEGLAAFVAEHTSSRRAAELVFICTHNSRRSQFAQIWAHTAAQVYGVPGVATYSGGTEATAFEPRAVAALERAGFLIEHTGTASNPTYRVLDSDSTAPIECFSKVYTDPPNPSAGFCAVMTCSSADRGCPVVFGAETRLTLAYPDPKAFDDTPGETSAYDDRCRQIAREMLWAFSGVA